jgi:hypothetical protein
MRGPELIMKKFSPLASAPKAFGAIAFIVLVFIGCGGGGGAGAPAAPAAAAPAQTVATTPATALTPPDTSLPALSLPNSVASGSVIDLACGRVYRGTLDLRNKSNVTVRTTGTCGKAVITPAREITGWTRHQGDIYSAPIAFDAAQVVIDGAPVPPAHWPNQPWVRAAGSTATTLQYAMPNADLAGATLVFKPYEWTIEARRVTAYAGNTMTLAATGNTAYDGYALSGTPEFYVQGKLWMLDQPGEWAVSGGRLYVWTRDGASPEGRAWAAPDSHGIDAADSASVTIQDVRIYAAANGINAPGAADLRIASVEVANSSENGIVNSGGARLSVDRSSIRNSVHDAITVHWGGGGESITNSSIDASGTVGLPANARAAINLTVGSGANIVNNIITNSAYIGVRVFRNATVAGNTVDGACAVLTDCGGLFTSARDRLPLNTRLSGNTVRNVGWGQRLAWAVYLGDYANGVTVSNNVLTASGNGMQIYNGYDNLVSGNSFSASDMSHIQIVEAGGSAVVRNNTVTGNAFSSLDGEESWRISSDLGAASVAQFGTYSSNSYRGSAPVFANFNGEALGFAQWQTRTGQDGASTWIP